MFLRKKESNQMDVWKENLLKSKARKEEKENRIKLMKESGEMYNNMVSDAVVLITKKITEYSKSMYGGYKEENGIVTITIYRALTITTDLHLLCGCWSIPNNPKTGKQCFYYSYQFENEDEVKRFFEDVKSQVPEEIKFNEYIDENNGIFKGARVYDVHVSINLNN